MRRIAILALAGAALLPSQALAADVRVTDLNGQTTNVSLSSLEGSEDVRDTEYAVGGSSRTVTGFSLESILEEAKADPYNWQYLEVMRPGGGSIVLSDEDVQDSGVFPDGPPVVSDDGASATFLRPSRGGGDDNSADQVSGNPLDVVLQKGLAIEVEASASAVKVDQGEEVHFNATARAPAGETLAYSWHFDDGADAQGASVSHSWKEPGSYEVFVGVTSSTDDVGGSDSVRVEVGKLKKGGPDREGGGNNQADDAPDSGTAGGGYGSGTGGYGTGSGGTGTGTGGASGAGTEAATGPGETQEAPQKAKPESAVPGGERVSGELLEATPASSSAAPEGESAGARTGNPAEESGFGLSAGALAALITGGLLGIGALKESERLRFDRFREAVNR